ncbi:hypothetical protein [Streptomyces litchfieldiae]|uniref:Secreted protein n=1 Tax=Streptomyces litchfieldiae TaxID=3075543 RepID=A0ABU2MUW1_9ACTN|nr:hypothetical protein [Streptomyces sp. DSM 44938]MDT0345431.1 hypothetical protein [Streptomyces sp. DSM 44938]
MNTATRVGAFGAGLALAFGTAFGVGSLVGPVGSNPEPADHGEHSAADATPAPAPDTGAETPGGLQISERGYTLVPPAEPLTVGEVADFRFRILGPDGEPLTAYEESHEKDPHLIVVRRDLSGFQHLHPVLGEDGMWSVPLTLSEAGDYRMFADFVPAGDPGGGLTLGADVAVAGEYGPEPLPEPARTATVDGYTVTLDGDLTAGASGELTLNVSRDGRPVTDLQPYLGAYGHLVALRAGDLAYLHVHPREGGPGPDIGFDTEIPSAGTYRLYLDFQHEGTVHTAEFTVTVGDDAPAPAAEDSGDHAH